MNSMRTRSPSTVTSRITPRSTSEMTGISGSGISSSAAQTASAVTTARPESTAAPRSSSSQSSASSGRCVPRSIAVTGSRPMRRASSGRSSGSSTPSANGHSSSTASRNRGSLAKARRPQLRVQAVVGLLAVDLRREARQLGVLRLHQAVDADAVGLLVEIAAGDRVRPLEQMQLDERRAAVVVRLAVERERVGVGVELAAPRARTARAHARSRSVRSTRTRRPPRASARSRSTPSPASRGSARRQRSTEGAMPARSRAMRNLSLIE